MKPLGKLLLREILCGSELTDQPACFDRIHSAHLSFLLIQTPRVAYIVEVKRRIKIGREIEQEINEKVTAFPKRRGISIRTALVYDVELDEAVARSGVFDVLLPFSRLLGIEEK